MKLASLLAVLLVSGLAVAAELSYRLEPRRIAPDTYIVEGTTENFSRSNGGNIVNVAFVVTQAGVVLVDTGPSAAYGRQLRAAIARVTDKPVVRVYNTHLHPDHFLGNQAFADVGVAADDITAEAIRQQGQDLAANLYRLVGDWMRGTEPMVPQQRVQDVETIGGHVFRILRLAGHTASDLAILDETTGVLFAGDVVFHQRTPTTPHADIAAWLRSLDELERLDVAVLVPGHGPVATDDAPIAQTRGYLRWLDGTLKDAAARGLDMTEAMALPIPPEFAVMALAREEYLRSVVHLYPGIEATVLRDAVRQK